MANLPTFEQLLEAQRKARGEGLGSTISRGISEGQDLAATLAKRKQEAALSEQQKQEFQLKVQKALQEAEEAKRTMSVKSFGAFTGMPEADQGVLAAEHPKGIPITTAEKMAPSTSARIQKDVGRENSMPLMAFLSSLPADFDKVQKAEIASQYPEGRIPITDANVIKASAVKGITTPMAEARITALQQQILNNVVPAASKNKVLKDSAIMIFQDDRLQALNEFAKGNPTAQEVEEMTVAFDRILRGGGVPPVTEIRRLVPASLPMEANKVIQWLKAEPQGSGQQALIARMVGGAAREKAVAEKNIRQELAKMKLAIAPKLQKDPEFMKVLSEVITSSYPEDKATVGKSTSAGTKQQVGKYIMEVE